MGSPTHDHGRDRFGNPEDLAEYLGRLDDAGRDEWQKPDEVVRALELDREMVVGEIGAGSGYFTFRLAPLAALVYASDADPRLLEVLRTRLASSGLRNVIPTLALPEDPALPARCCDRVVTVNTFHHFPDPPDYLRRIAGALRPGGRIAVIDFHEKIARDDVMHAAKAAGLRVAAEHEFLPQQHFSIFY
jgi:cyclopropane fatty-acyl-phospholipid synthase-like methyltransferase